MVPAGHLGGVEQQNTQKKQWHATSGGNWVQFPVEVTNDSVGRRGIVLVSKIVASKASSVGLQLLIILHIIYIEITYLFNFNIQYY